MARCWAYETSILTDTSVPEALPHSEYHEYFAPNYSLNVAGHKSMDDMNTKAVSAGEPGHVRSFKVLLKCRWSEELCEGVIKVLARWERGLLTNCVRTAGPLKLTLPG